MTKLIAVNRMLRGIGLDAVRALDTGGFSTQGKAERILDEYVTRILSDGWHFNTKKAEELTPDSSGEVAMPDGAIGVIGEDLDAGIVSVLGDKLVNRDPSVPDNSDTFATDRTLTGELTLLYRWECIPHAIQEYIADSAAVELCRAYSDQRRLPMLLKAELEGKVKARRFDTSSRNTNVLSTPEAQRITGSRNAWSSW